MTKAPTTTTRKKEKKPDGRTARAAHPLTWSAVEYVPRLRWWTFVAIGWFAVPLALILVVYDNVLGAVLAILIAVAWFVVYLPKPKIWSYTLKGGTLTAVRERRRGGADELTLDLGDYRAFRAKVMRTRARAGGAEHFVLQSKRRFARSRDVYLPEDFEQAIAIGEALNRTLPYLDDTALEDSEK